MPLENIKKVVLKDEEIVLKYHVQKNGHDLVISS